MSEYVEAETQIRDCPTLVDALMAMGFTREEIEVHGDARPLNGYDQGQPRRAQVIVRLAALHRAAPGKSVYNDLGFEHAADGRFVAHLPGDHYGQAWLGRVQGQYAVRNETRYWKGIGYRVSQRTDAKGMIHLTVES